MTRRTGPDQATRDAVYARDESHCVICGGSYGLSLHHRSPRKAGGTRRPEINSPANLVVLCIECHEFTERNRELARDRGYLVGFGQVSADVPIIWHGQHVLLTDNGGVEPVEDAA